jgi:hypothetical protein
MQNQLRLWFGKVVVNFGYLQIIPAKKLAFTVLAVQVLCRLLADSLLKNNMILTEPPKKYVMIIVVADISP